MRSDLFEDVCPPGLSYKMAHTATAYRFRIPEDWYGEMVTFTSDSSRLSVAIGDANVIAGDTEYATLVDDVLAPNMASGFIVPAGGSISWPMPTKEQLYYTHIAVDSSAADGNWSAARSSGRPIRGESFPLAELGMPSLWLDGSDYRSWSVSSGITKWKCQFNQGLFFEEASNKPDAQDVATAGTGLLRPAASFVTANSDKLVCTNTVLCALLSGVLPHTIGIATRRSATGALHTLFSGGTNGSNNGRFDLTMNASEDPVYTRVTGAGASTNSTFADTINGLNLHVVSFSGSAPTYYLDRVVKALTGTAAGDVGTLSKLTLGARGYNTSTYDQFGSFEISDVVILPYDIAAAGNENKLTALHNWLKRRHGK